MINDSYDIVFKSLTKKIKAELETEPYVKGSFFMLHIQFGKNNCGGTYDSNPNMSEFEKRMFQY